jgi:hypothetical protein
MFPSERDLAKWLEHRLNMELDLQNLFGLHVHNCTHWLRPRNPLPPAFGLIYEGTIGQPRQTTSLCDPWVRASDRQCLSRNCPGFDPSVLRHVDSEGPQMKQC